MLVPALGSEGRIEVDEVHGFGDEAVAQDIKVVALPRKKTLTP